MIYQLIADIPAEFTLVQTTAEIQRRVEETLYSYFPEQDKENQERVPENDMEYKVVRYATPYELMAMVHMQLWNEIVVDATKSPPELNKKFVMEPSRLLQNETIYSVWYV